MTILRVLAFRLRGLFVKNVESNLSEEMDTHISLLAEEYERAGMSPREARMAARRQFGGVAQITETYREQHRLPFVDGLWQDLGYAFRQLRHSPIFAIAAVLTLALGIGANTAVFRVLDTLLLRSLPVRQPDQLVQLQPLEFGKTASFAYPTYRDLASQHGVIAEAIAGGDLWHPERVAIQGRGSVKLQNGRLVTGNYFAMLGVPAALGRVFTQDDDRPGAAAVAVISYRFWDREFGRSPAAIGKILEINSVPLTIVGVTPQRFSGERVFFAPDIWLPLSLQPRVMQEDWLKTGNFNFLDVLARLQPRVSRAQAQAALDPIYRRLLARESGRDRLQVISGHRGVIIPEMEDPVLQPITAMMGMVALLLLIACCNLANLLLARGAARTHEIGVRLALGAGRWRLVRQLLTESLLLSGTSTILGAGIAMWGTQVLAQWALDSDTAPWVSLSIGWRVMAFAAAVSIGATCVFGVAPALAGTRLDIRSALQGSRRMQSQSRPRQRLGKAFVVAQVSICLMLLAGAALLARSLWNLQRQDWGFRPQHLLMADLPIRMDQAFDSEKSRAVIALRQPILERIATLPGVRSATLVADGPLGNNTWTSEISAGASGTKPVHSFVVRGTSRYFETMGISILAGRPFDASDREKSARVAVLTETAARRIFNGADALGKLISLDADFGGGTGVQVVGIAHDVRLFSPAEVPGPVVFLPLEQQPMPFNSLVLRADVEPASLANSVRTALHEVAPQVELGSIESVTEMLDDKNANQQVITMVAAVFGLLALALASAGLYGVISYAVESRTQEMGIRLALGATPAQVTTLIMREVAFLLGLGLVLGGAASVAGTRVLRSLLFGITVRDGAWLLLAGLLLLVLSALAGYLPARRASRLNLLDALRQE